MAITYDREGKPSEDYGPKKDEWTAEDEARTGISKAQADDFAARNEGDYHRVESAFTDQGRDYDSQLGPGSNTGGSSSPTTQWNAAGSSSSQSGGLFPDWYRELMTRQVATAEADRAQNKERADALYGTLQSRAGQGLNVSPQDPIIKGQVDAYGAQQERSRRGYLSDLAERMGPYANTLGEARMTAEKAGQATGGFQAELLGRELTSKRNEIAQALASMGGMLSGDQTRALQQQLAQMDQAIAEANAQTSRTSMENQFTLGTQSLDLQRLLGLRGLDQGQDQFLRNLALQTAIARDNSDLNWFGPRSY